MLEWRPPKSGLDKLSPNYNNIVVNARHGGLMLGLAYYRSPSGRSPVEEYIESQDDESRACIKVALLAFCEEFPKIETVSIKPLRDKLWEIRVADPRSRQHRLLYVVMTRSLVVLHAFTKKTQKTPQKEMKLALRRLQQLLK